MLENKTLGVIKTLGVVASTNVGERIVRVFKGGGFIVFLHISRPRH